MVNFTGGQTLDQIMINFVGTLERHGISFPGYVFIIIEAEEPKPSRHPPGRDRPYDPRHDRLARGRQRSLKALVHQRRCWKLDRIFKVCCD
ncbi:uncharacterized protein TrAtP1_002366 [Trichoderma atroviride]|uniref:uncharacterized protein n=1 Tax=Hypocrea atroviridis TaxID=63577 RepID=UPI00332D5F1F|nr:hypothetical protein TrAtP1_002366 [Trichoderma atroviride]